MPEKSKSFKIKDVNVETHAHTTRNADSALRQIETFGDALDKKYDYDKDSHGGSFFDRQIKEDEDNETTNVEEIELDGDTTSINIQTSSNMMMNKDIKLLSGTSQFKQSSLKKMNRSLTKKNLKVNIDLKNKPGNS